jgi:predicted DNA-binding transcriptional regulator AlpA
MPHADGWADPIEVTENLEPTPPTEAALLDDQVLARLQYGLPDTAFARAWTIEDIAEYAGLHRTKAYALMRTAGAPAPLRLGRSRRWNGLQILAWLHREEGQPAMTRSAPVKENPVIPLQPPQGRAPLSTGTPPSTLTAELQRTDAQTTSSATRAASQRVVVIDPAVVQAEHRQERIDALAAHSPSSRKRGPVRGPVTSPATPSARAPEQSTKEDAE